jgi:hypothetical protein
VLSCAIAHLCAPGMRSRFMLWAKLGPASSGCFFTLSNEQQSKPRFSLCFW